MNSLILTLSSFIISLRLISLTLLLNFLRLLEQLGRWLVQSTLTHHAHRIHPRLRCLHYSRILLLSLRRGCLISNCWSHLVPNRIEVDRLLRDVLESLLLRRLLKLHLVKLACHHLLSLHVHKLLLHHSHSLGIASLCCALIAFCGLACSCVSHDHLLHHVSERVGT